MSEFKEELGRLTWKHFWIALGLSAAFGAAGEIWGGRFEPEWLRKLWLGFLGIGFWLTVAYAYIIAAILELRRWKQHSEWVRAVPDGFWFVFFAIIIPLAIKGLLSFDWSTAGSEYVD